MTLFPGPGPYLMGIVNVTPDSFSDGGTFHDPDRAIAHGRALAREGACILDIGGESTRPGAEPVEAAEEIRRVVPVLRGLRGCTPFLSIDTRHAATMEAALEAGANFINDISALSHDPRALSVAARAGVPVCLMHMRGTPRTMQDCAVYDSVVDEVFAFLSERIAACIAAGIAREKIVVDPGIGFAKTLAHNIEIQKNIDRFADLGVPILLGASRKRFIAALDRECPPEERLAGSLAAVLAARSRGVRLFRVHDVAATRQALAVFDAVRDEKAPRPKLYLIHGYIGAGKTHFSKTLASETGAIRFTMDEWVASLYGSNPPGDFSQYESRIRLLMLPTIEALLRSGQSVILDFGFWGFTEREEMRLFARSMNAEPVLCHVFCSRETARARTRQRTLHMPAGAVFVDDNAFDSLFDMFEALRDDEDRITVKTE